MEIPEKRKKFSSVSSDEGSKSKTAGSAIESCFLSNLAFYTAIFIYVMQNLLQFWWGAVEEAHFEPDDFRKYTIPVARGAGYMINFNMVLIMLFASRFLITKLEATPLNLFFPFDKAMPLFHMIAGYNVFFSAAVHGIFHIVPGIIESHWQSGYGGWTFCVVTGFVIFGVFVIMVITARKKTRERRFEAFYYTHVIGAAIFIALLFVHGQFRGVEYTYKWISAPVALYIVDRLISRFYSHRVVLKLENCTLRDCGGGVLRLSVPKSFSYKPGQYARIKVPSISTRQWHPFTIASSDHQDEMVFFIKAAGDWTDKLHERMKKQLLEKENLGEKSFSAKSTSGSCDIYIKGPYGAPAEHVGQYESVVLISGGVGSAPFLSVVKAAVHDFEYSYQGRACREDMVESTEDNNLMRKIMTYTPSTMANVGQPLLRKNPTLAVYATEPGLPDDKSRSMREAVKTVLYSVATQTLLGWILILRLYLFMFAASIKETRLVNSPGFRVATNGFMGADLALAITFAIPLGVSVLVELPPKCFREILDILLLVPLSVLTIIGHILGLANVGISNPSTKFWPFFFYFAIFPLVFVLYAARYFSIIGEASLIAPSRGHEKAPAASLDFIWTVPKKSDDQWLAQELEPHGYSKFLRLHRFLTKESPDLEESDQGIGRFVNNFGRPKWKSVFDTLVKNTRSGSTVGVFFCGPKKMEYDVHEAAIDAMTDSINRSHHTQPEVAKKGCDIRFVFRPENF